MATFRAAKTLDCSEPRGPVTFPAPVIPIIPNVRFDKCQEAPKQDADDGCLLPEEPIVSGHPPVGTELAGSVQLPPAVPVGTVGGVLLEVEDRDNPVAMVPDERVSLRTQRARRSPLL